MLAVYILIVFFNIWMINCDEMCACQEINALKETIREEMLDRRLEATRMLAKIHKLEATQKSQHGASDCTVRLDKMDTKISDLDRKLNASTREMHEENMIAIVEKALTSEKQEWTESKSDLESQMSAITDIVAEYEELIPKNKTGCFSGRARDYTGTKSTTASGYQCQSWGSQKPHEHKYKEKQFSDCSFCQAKNYCRDPGNDGFLWCYTIDPDKRWEGCGIPWCEEPERNNNTFDCYIITAEDRRSGKSDKELCESNVNRFEVNANTTYTISGCKDCCCQSRDCHPSECPECYSGTWHRAVSGRECQRWDSQEPHKHKFNEIKMFRREKTVAAAHNYCRDPSESGYLWCYTMDPNQRWEKCDIREC
ncbi:plasminogen-like [Mercenaria mercenaria]|uniref:plasminogen-like n=1 Tax=Mercenaria mercenaria TaxID=6596 RepID=UPI00234E4C6F|nr:plasminogen-like [Mercenaria mercenaria]